MFEIWNPPRISRKKVRFKPALATAEKVGVTDGVFREWDVVGPSGSRQREGEKSSAESLPSFEHGLSGITDVLLGPKVTARFTIQPSILPRGSDDK